MTPAIRSKPPPLPKLSLATGDKVRTNEGRTLTLGGLLKSGGAGSVFRLDEDAALVAKIYHAHVDHKGPEPSSH